MLDQEKIKHELIAEIAVLLGRSERIEEHWKHEEAPGDWEELAVHRENDEVMSSLDERAHEKVNAIRRTLQRMEADEWQTCVQCGEAIPESRLAALPTTPFCINCAAKTESSA